MLEHGVFSDVSTKLGTVTSLFSRSHPLAYRRKLAQTKRGALSLVPEDTQEGDVICKFFGSQIPYILRPISDEHWKRKEEISIWSRMTSKILTWMFWLRQERNDLENLDGEISRLLKEKSSENGNGEVEHYIFIGECYVDGLMQRESGTEAADNSKQRIAFALH